MRVRLLGPVDVVVDGVAQPVRGLRRTAVLAALTLHRGEIVSVDRLADVLWGEQPPETPVNTLQTHVSYLRRVLGDRTAIVSRRPGYLLDADLVDSDVAEAERAIGPGGWVGERVADPARGQRIRDALGLWRGRSLPDVAGLPWLEEQARRLEQLRLRGVRELVEIRLALGEHAEILPELTELVDDHPFDERLHGQLMVALYRSGRQVEALAAYQHLRRSLRDELAIDPGQPLRDLEAAILRQDRTLDPEPVPVVAFPRRRVPRGVELPEPAQSTESPPSAQPSESPESPASARRTEPSPGPEVRAGAPPLLEREQPLALLGGYAAEARAGQGRLVLIGGEAGIGKSALVERLRADLPAARWSWGACDGLFTPRPLGPLFDLADQLGGGLLAACRAGADREELFRGLLSAISGPETLDVVVVEDIHWADEATLDLLRFLGRRLRDGTALVIATYRDDGLGAADPLRVVLGDLASQRSTRRISLAPLSAGAVRALAGIVGANCPEVAELHRLTGGNPFYLTEALRAGMAEVPASARDAVLARAARVRPAAREVLDVAALSGTRVEARLLESVTGCPPSDLDELMASGLLVGDGGWLRFRHEIARRAVGEAVATHRRPAIHRLVLAALESLGCDDAARLAFHAEEAADGSAVLRHAPAAARRAARLASHREAVAQLERALRFAAGSDPVTRAELLEDLADEAALLDRWSYAADAAERALALWREADDRLREGGVLRRLSRIMWRLCRGADAIAAIEAAVAALEPLGPGVELARAYAIQAGLRMLHADHDAAIELALRAQSLADRLGASDVLSDALNTQAASVASTDQEWAGQLHRALELAVSGDHPDQAARAYANLCMIHTEKYQFADAERCLAEGIAYCDEHDLTGYARCLRGVRAAVLERTGRWTEAAALNARLQIETQTARLHRLWTLTRLGASRARRDEPGVWERLDEAVVIAEQTGQPQEKVSVRLARAEAYWLAGRPGEARREAELADDVVAGLDAWQRGAVAIWLHRTGSGRPVREPVAEPYRLLLAGDAAGAARVWTDLGCPYEAALAFAEVPVESALRAALTILTDLGAPPAARMVRRRLASRVDLPEEARHRPEDAPHRPDGARHAFELAGRDCRPAC